MQASFLLQRELKKQIECNRSHSAHFYPHFHSHIEICLVLSGEIEVLINDRKKLLGAGEFSVSFSYDTHAYRTPKESETIYLIFPTTFCEEFLPMLSARCLPSPYLSDPRVYQTVLDAMERLMACDNDISRRGQLYVILGTIYDQMLPRNEEELLSPHGSTAEILIYIGEHFREELKLSQVARTFGYHPSYFSRYFRNTFGISFVRYLIMLRLREAVLLLQSGKRTVTECAIESGFGSMRSFYRAFYEEFESNPGDYLKQKSEV